MNVDIFIKTYPRDHQWLPYLFKSIAKYCRGFRQIVLITEGNKDKLSDKLQGSLISLLPVKAHFVNPAVDDGRYKDRVGRGYQEQKAIKMMWTAFTDADAVLQVDSDMIFARETTPEDFRLDGKPVWLRKEWDDSSPGERAMWMEGVEWFSQGFPAYWNYMIRPGFYLTREATLAFSDHLKTLGFDDPFAFFTSLEIPHCSVYNTFGIFLDRFAKRYPWSGQREEGERHHFGYELLKAEEFGKKCPLLQYWSWGGIKPEIKSQIESILS